MEVESLMILREPVHGMCSLDYCSAIV